MPDLYSKGDFDLAGFCVGVVELKRVQKPSRVNEGDVILGLLERWHPQQRLHARCARW